MLPTIIILKRSSFATANCQFPLPRNLFLGRQCRNKSQAEAEKFNGTARIENPPKQPLLNLKAEITSIFTSRYTIRNALVPRFIALLLSAEKLEFQSDPKRADFPFEGKQTHLAGSYYSIDVSMINPFIEMCIYLAIDRSKRSGGEQATRFWIEVWLKVVTNWSPFWRRIKRSFLGRKRVEGNEKPRFRSSGIYKVGSHLRDFEISNSQDSFLAAFYADPLSS